MKNTRKDEKGSALIIVLAFLFLLTIVTIAFLSRSLLERQLSNASLNQNKIDLVAQGAAASIIGDLQQEIVTGSSPISATGIYYPLSPTDVIPSLAVPGYTSSTIIGSGMEDLIKVSNHANGATDNRASAINTTSNASLNFRSISAARWNKALLLAKQSPTTSDRTPVSVFPTPDWIYVARDGSNPGNGGTSVSINSGSPYISLPSVDPSAAISAQAGHNPITQRYAYTVYDEGSTLDMNVAGSPATSSGSTLTYTTQQPFKNALAYADLTQLLSGFGLDAPHEEAFVNGIVGWRNNGSGQASGSFPSYDLSANFPTSFPPTSPAAPFDAFILFTMGGFLSAGGNATQSDNAFTSRQQLLQYLTTPTFLTAAGLTDAQMQTLGPYLGTFTRDIDQPSYAPPSGRPKVLAATNGGNNGYNADDLLNPSFLGVTVPPNATFTRNDGSAPVAGEPLVKKRFALNRIAWVTYAGPSESRNMSDPDMQALINYGIPASFLQEGTAANIQRYFGLTWDGTKWNYNVNNGGSGPIQKIAAMTTLHDPDFFELLKSAIAVGSVGKAVGNSTTEIPPDAANLTQQEQPTNFNYYAESSVDYQIIQIGANIIDQFQPANYAVQIFFNDGKSVNPRTIVGVENLPYLLAINNGVLCVKYPDSLPRSSQAAGQNSGTPGNSYYQSTDVIGTGGVGAWMQIPVIWNPHDPSSPVGAAGPTSFRMLADSTTPDGVISNSSRNKFFVYAEGDSGSSNTPTYSYSIDPPTPVSFQNPGGNTNNEEIDFSVPFGAKELCPEPLVVMRSSQQNSSSTGSPVTDSNNNSYTFSLPSNDFLITDLASKASGLVSTLGVKSNYFSNALAMQANIPAEVVDSYNKNTYIGFYLGSFPLAWNPGTGPASAAQGGAFLARSGTGPGGIPFGCYMTYRMQYKDSQGNWVTYDTKYGRAYLGDALSFYAAIPTGYSGALLGSGDWGFVTDPRTSRFGIMSNGPGASPNPAFNTIGAVFPGPEVSPNTSGFYWLTMGQFAKGWLDTTNGIAYTTRPDGQSGFYSYSNTARTSLAWPSQIGTTSGWMAYIGSNGVAVAALAPGMLSQNNTDAFTTCFAFYGDSQGNGIQAPNYFADPDGIVRRAMGGFVAIGSTSSPGSAYSGSDTPSADATVGLPMARVFDWNRNLSAPAKTSANPTIVPLTPATGPSTGSVLIPNQSQSRPYFLHRPFNSVAELGYVFSDTPWRNLDFFTAESGDTALLDTFCISDTNDPNKLVAGKVNLNTRQAPVLQAIIAGGCLDPVLQSSTSTNTLAISRIDPTTAMNVAKALVARTTDTTNIPNGTGPLGNVSELVGKWQNNIAIRSVTTQVPESPLSSSHFYDGKLSYSGFGGGVWDTTNHKPLANGVENFTSGTSQSTGTAEDIYSAYFNSASFTSNKFHNGTQETATYIQRFREAPIRALAAAGTTRVWSLMIDVIAQAGRFPSSATGLDQFNVEGERRYWIHVAIDRLTGKVLDEQIEEVKE